MSRHQVDVSYFDQNEPPRSGIDRLRLKRVSFWMSSTDISQGHWPGRGLICSVLIHGSVLSGLLFIPPSLSFVRMPPRPLRVTMIDLKDPNYRLYLPVLHGAEPPE